jgi:hypothetical protein
MYIKYVYLYFVYKIQFIKGGYFMNDREKESEVEPASGIFSDYKWGAEILKAGANFLKREWFDGEDNSFEHIRRVKVLFDKDVQSEEFENDFGSKLVTIYAPVIEAESDQEIKERHRFLVKYYGNGIQDAHLGVVAKFLSLLSPEAQRNLVNEENANNETRGNHEK